MNVEHDTIAARLDQVGALDKGNHSAHNAMCVMEAVAFVAGEAWSDAPTCCCPVLGALLRAWNDDLPDSERDALLRPLIPGLIGTRSTRAVERRRSSMALDWIVREYTPVWLRLAGLPRSAAMLSAIAEIDGLRNCQGLTAELRMALNPATAIKDAAGSRPGEAGWEAAKKASKASAGTAAMSAIGVAAETVTWSGQDWAIAVGTAGTAIEAAATKVGPSAMERACHELQQSALCLIDRMIAVQEVVRVDLE